MRIYFIFYLLSFISKTQKISYQFYFTLLLSFACFASISMGSNENTKLCDFTSHKNSDFIFTPIHPPGTSTEFYEIKPTLLNLVMKEQFSGVGEDAASHLNNFIEFCDMQKYKEMDGDIFKLKLFPFPLRWRAKECLQSSPKNNIDSWSKCKDGFIGMYYPPAKII